MSIREDFDDTVDDESDVHVDSALLEYAHMDNGHRHEALRHAVHLAGLSVGTHTAESIVESARVFYNFLSDNEESAS